MNNHNTVVSKALKMIYKNIKPFVIYCVYFLLPVKMLKFL